MPGRFAVEKLTFYPHLMPDDVPVWERFLESHGDEWETVDYDIRVGSGSVPDIPAPPNFQKMQRELTRLRIDAVLYRENQAMVVEVKPRAGLSALGQITAYLRLFIEERGEGLDVSGGVVCSDVLPDVQRLLTESGIRVILV